MDVHVACEQCESEIRFSADETPPQTCPRCGDELELAAPDFAEGDRLTRCVVCGEEDFYESTQINPTFGVGLVIFGTLLFLACVYFIPGMNGFLWGMVVLLSLVVFDRIMRLLLPKSVVCYRCSTVYSGVDPDQSFEAYDHEEAAAIKYENTGENGT